MDNKAWRQYILDGGRKRGIDPEILERVVNSEGGFNNPVRPSEVVNKAGLREPSYGPFQMLVGGGDTGFPEGLGNDALKRGIDPRNPEHAQAAADFSLDTIARDGWGRWFGARDQGITGKMGINGQGVTLDSAPSSIGPTNAAPELPAGVNVASHPVAGVADDKPVMASAPTGEQSLGDKLGALLFGDKAADMKAAVGGTDKSNPVAAGLGAMTKAATRTAVPNDPIQSSLGASMGADAGRMQAAQQLMAQLLAKRQQPVGMSLPGRMV